MDYATVAAIAQSVAMSVANVVGRRPARADAGLVSRAPRLERVIGPPRAAQESAAAGRATLRGGLGSMLWRPACHHAGTCGIQAHEEVAPMLTPYPDCADVHWPRARYRLVVEGCLEGAAG
jgi:hypothetical protein